MGGQPLTALNLVPFHWSSSGPDVLRRILRRVAVAERRVV